MNGLQATGSYCLVIVLRRPNYYFECVIVVYLIENRRCIAISQWRKERRFPFWFMLTVNWGKRSVNSYRP